MGLGGIGGPAVSVCTVITNRDLMVYLPEACNVLCGF